MSPFAEPSRLADLEHPWVGLESYREDTRDYFFGRDSEIAEICLRLRSQPLFVLYGRSGYGKTSVLSAGVIPRLREENQNHRVEIHRLSYRQEDPSPFHQLLSHLGLRDATEAFPFSLPDDAPSRLWLHIHRKLPWSGITHLVLDQFEEVFTVEAQRVGIGEEVREALGILIQGAIPKSVARCLGAEDAFFDYFDPDSQPVRVILALRDDYVYALNRWRRHLPQLGQNYFELRALRGPAAFDAVFEPGRLRAHKHVENGILVDGDTGLPPLVTETTARRIVRFVAERKEDVPLEEIEAVPPILSLLCRELNQRRYQQSPLASEPPQAQIVFDEKETNVETILENFYERCLVGRPEAVRIFIEEDLVSHSGNRLQNDESSIVDVFFAGYKIPGDEMGRLAAGYGDHGAATACLRELVNERLLSPAVGGENPRYELTHDLLARIIFKNRTARQEHLEIQRLDRRAKEEAKAKEEAEDRAKIERALRQEQEARAAEAERREQAEAARAAEAERREQAEAARAAEAERREQAEAARAAEAERREQAEAARAAEAERRAELQREATLKAAEQERKSAIEHAERERQLERDRTGRRIIAGMTVGIVIVFVLAVVAFVQWQNAERLQNIAKLGLKQAVIENDGDRNLRLAESAFLFSQTKDMVWYALPAVVEDLKFVKKISKELNVDCQVPLKALLALYTVTPLPRGVDVQNPGSTDAQNPENIIPAMFSPDQKICVTIDDENHCVVRNEEFIKQYSLQPVPDIKLTKMGFNKESNRFAVEGIRNKDNSNVVAVWELCPPASQCDPLVTLKENVKIEAILGLDGSPEAKLKGLYIKECPPFENGGVFRSYNEKTAELLSAALQNIQLLTEDQKHSLPFRVFGIEPNKSIELRKIDELPTERIVQACKLRFKDKNNARRILADVMAELSLPSRDLDKFLEQTSHNIAATYLKWGDEAVLSSNAPDSATINRTIDFYSKARDIYPDIMTDSSPENRFKANTLVMAGNKQRENGDIQAAENSYKEAKKLAKAYLKDLNPEEDARQPPPPKARD